MPKTFNIDVFNEKKTGFMNDLANAIRSGEEGGIEKALDAWQSFMSDSIMDSFKEYQATADSQILAQRGVRQLTSKETDYYNKFIAAATKNEGVITGIMDVLPETIINSVLEDITREHELLSVIDFQNTTAITAFLTNTKGAQTAVWGPLNSEITKKLEGEVKEVKTTLKKLTAYMFCTMDMLALGPQWVDAYVRKTLKEALATGLEVGIVDGNGLEEPIGMTRNVSAPTDEETGKPRKNAVAITDFSQDTYGDLLADLAKTPNGNARKVTSVILVVNPVDYFKIVFKATTDYVSGSYRMDLFPFPTRVIQSVGVPEKHAVIGIANNYFMGLGASKDGKIEYTDDYKFLEDWRTYKIKFYGMGLPVDNNSFVYLDITNVKRIAQSVVVEQVKGTVKTKEQE